MKVKPFKWVVLKRNNECYFACFKQTRSRIQRIYTGWENKIHEDNSFYANWEEVYNSLDKNFDIFLYNTTEDMIKEHFERFI